MEKVQQLILLIGLEGLEGTHEWLLQIFHLLFCKCFKNPCTHKNNLRQSSELRSTSKTVKNVSFSPLNISQAFTTLKMP